MGRWVETPVRHGLAPWIEPRAAIYVWGRVPDDVSAADVARHALTRKVMFAPGPAFSVSDEARGCLRFNVARCGEPRIYDVLDEAIAAAPRRDWGKAAHAAL